MSRRGEGKRETGEKVNENRESSENLAKRQGNLAVVGDVQKLSWSRKLALSDTESNLCLPLVKSNHFQFFSSSVFLSLFLQNEEFSDAKSVHIFPLSFRLY